MEKEKSNEEECENNNEFHDEDINNIFFEEFLRVSYNKKQTIRLSEVLKMSKKDENGEYKINLCHVRKTL